MLTVLTVLTDGEGQGQGEVQGAGRNAWRDAEELTLIGAWAV